MSVERFRSVADMPPPAPVSRESLADRIRLVWARARRLAPCAPRAGVQKFSDVDAARQARELEQRECSRHARDAMSAAGQ